MDLLSMLQPCKVLRCVFNGSSKTYSYKAALDLTVAVGDSVVVDSPIDGLTLVTVVKIDDDIDPEASFDYKWIVQRVDRAGYDEQMALDRSRREELKQLIAKRKKKQKIAELITELGEDVPEWLK